MLLFFLFLIIITFLTVKFDPEEEDLYKVYKTPASSSSSINNNRNSNETHNLQIQIQNLRKEIRDLQMSN